MARARGYTTPYIRMTRDLRTWDRQVRADPEMQRLVDEEREAQDRFRSASLSSVPGKSLGIAKHDLEQAGQKLRAALADKIPQWKREQKADAKAWREELARTGRVPPERPKPTRKPFPAGSLPTTGDPATMAKIRSTAAAYQPRLEEAKRERFEQASMLNSYRASAIRDPQREAVILRKYKAADEEVAALERAERLAPISGTFTTDRDADMATINSIELDLPERRKKRASKAKAPAKTKATAKRGKKSAKKRSGVSCKAAGKALAKCSASARKKKASKPFAVVVRKKPGTFAV